MKILVKSPLAIITAVALTTVSCSNAMPGIFGRKDKQEEKKPEPAVQTQTDNNSSRAQTPQQPAPAQRPIATPVPQYNNPAPQQNVPQNPGYVQQPAPQAQPFVPGPALPPPPKNNPIAKPVPQPLPTDDAVALLPVRGVRNMEKKETLTSDGGRWSLTSESGQVFAAGDMDGRAILRGEPAEGGVFVLSPKVKFLDASVGNGYSGPAQLTVCVPNDMNASFDQPVQCSAGGSASGDRQSRIVKKPVNVTIADKKVKINAGAPTVSIGHSVFASTTAFAKEMQRDDSSPLVFDLSRKGKLDLHSAWDDRFKTSFDFTGNNLLVRTGWIGTKSALLAIDLNNNNQIDSGVELFGEFSAKRDPTSTRQSFENGFIALAQYDEKNLGYIDAANPVFSKLKLWKDKNFNGKTDKDELITLSSLSIVRINLDYKKNDRNVNVKGNRIPLVSTYETKDGKKHLVGDVFFEIRDKRALAEIMK